MLTERSIDRRSFLRMAGVAGLGLPALVSACTAPAPAAPTAAPPAAQPTTAAPPAAQPTSVPAAPAPATAAVVPTVAAPPAAAAKLQLPTFVAAQAAKADLPATEAGLQAGFLTYPKDLVKSVTRVPGSGGDVSAFVNTTNPVPPGMDDNAAWQAVNKALNATMKMQLVPSTDYVNKASTAMAGGDLPDLFYLGNNLTAVNIPRFLKAAYADLTPYLAGDAVKEYPNLAAFPASAWSQTVFDGAIWGVPLIRPAFNNITYINQTQFDAIGATQPRNADDFRRILLELTRPQENRWGIAGLTPGYGLVYDGHGECPQLAMFGTPNNWAVDSGGRFTKDIETENFRAALGWVRDLYAAGAYYPDVLSQASQRTNFLAGKVAVMTTGWGSYASLLWTPGRKLSPPVDTRTLAPFAADGGKPIWHRSLGFNGLTGVKKGSPERIKELLRILDYMAAPFGSEEFHLLNYGVADIDHTLDERGNPVLTQRGTSETNIYGGWRYLSTSMPVLFDPADAEFARVAYAAEETWVPVLVNDPSLGLYSETDTARYAQLTAKFFDGIGDIVTGRAPLSNLDQLRQDWRGTGGDQIRAEFERAYAAARA
jgi:putative aldouronate transport system substrate-binding protein